ncbi:unnamed protein product [Adineta ricciae]|uniref:HECT domain-containing protein n=1 Tax=Adineta ricciae TaxID=249248 RepID=A0A813NWG6_ADIRI|nr:unnamed protein product [Adineta ricciae]CAF0792946.1 unnamed protein product [Adineta ricciae]
MDEYFTKLVSLIKFSDTIPGINTILSSDDQEDVNYFLPRERHVDLQMVSEHQLIARIQRYLLTLTNATEIRTWTGEINTMLKETILPQMRNDSILVEQTIYDELTKIAQLKVGFRRKSAKVNQLTAPQRGEPPKRRTSPLPSRLAGAVRDSNKVDISQATVVDIFSRFAKHSLTLRDILPVVNLLLFDTQHRYDVQQYIKELNTHQERTKEEWKNRSQLEWIASGNNTVNAASDKVFWNPIAYLLSVSAYPSNKLMILNKKVFTGQYVAAVIMGHIDIYHNLHADKQYQSGNLNSSLFFHFHPDTFRQLFHLIEQLVHKKDTFTNANLKFMLNMCLRLFTIHLKYLSILSRDDDWISMTDSNENDWNDYPTDEVWQTWYDLLFLLTTNEFQNTIHARQAMKAIVYILEKRIPLFSDRLSYMFQCIEENKCSAVTVEFSSALARDANIITWIDILSNESVKTNQGWFILESFIVHYHQSSASVQRIAERFQQLLFAQLMKGNVSILPIFIRYMTLIFNQDITKQHLMKSFLMGLSFLTVTKDQNCSVTFFIHILPILVDFILIYSTTEVIDNGQFYYLAWLLGQISHRLITDQLIQPLEIKYAEILKLPLFSSGRESNTMNDMLFQSNMAFYSHLKPVDYIEQTPTDDREFLLSVYNNIDQGAQLLSKMRAFSKNKQRPVQKSIEQQVNDACAHLFAVYLKHYRRVNLAKEELTRDNTSQPHEKLLSLFEYANRIQTTFATLRGQGGNCQELYEQIRRRTLFLVSFVRASHWISAAVDSMPKTMGDVRQRSSSNSSRLLRQTFNACTRFKKLIKTSKKRIDPMRDREEVLHHSIVSCVYGEQNQWNSEELLQCMSYQHERAMFRWVTYRFIYEFLSKFIKIEEKNRMMSFLAILVPHLRGMDNEWSYLENIPSANSRWKEQIGKVYYSIVQLLLSHLPESDTKTAILIFHLLNLPYTTDDIGYLHQYEFPQHLFTSFVTANNQSVAFETKCLGYQWFRLYVLQLWRHVTNKENMHELSEEKWIFDELKNLFIIEQNLVSSISFRYVALGSVQIGTVQNNGIVKHETNQYLMLLLRCVTMYEHVRNHCATLEYFEQLLNMYRNSTNLITILLVLKIIRQILFSLSEEQIITPVKNFLEEIFSTISDNIRSKEKSFEITTELIYIYRIIISTASPWQQNAIEQVINVIISSHNSFHSNDTKQLNDLLACLSILGGYIHSFGIGSIVQIYVGDQFDQETQLGVVLEIHSKSALPYLVQYCRTNETIWVTVDQLRIELDVLPPHLLDLPVDRATIGKVFDAIIYFIELDESLFDPVLILLLKRRSICALYRSLLTSKKLLEIFMDKPYASVIAKLSMTALSNIHRLQPTDMRLLNKRHLEQYCLSLDRCERMQQIVNDATQARQDELGLHVWHSSPFTNNFTRTNIPYSDLNSTQWAPAGSKQYVEDFTRGRIGNEEIRIVPMASEIAGQWFLEECGIKHRFPGRTYLVNEYGNSAMATFIVDTLRLSQGKWYFCVRLLESQFIRIGWATDGFNPSNTNGIGQDRYSWSFNGSQSMLYNQIESPFITNNISWNTHDVCGCGIEINGINTRINYWLNGHFLGTAFAHNFPIGPTDTICDMLPNTSETTYYPGVTLQMNDTTLLSSCEWIFSPEDMNECPLPEGYKPLIVPTVHTVVRYPVNAYILSINDQDNLYQSRTTSTNMFLRDFVSERHLQIEYPIKSGGLILSKETNGLPFEIVQSDSWTLSFDFKLSSDVSQEQICLFSLEPVLSVKLPIEKVKRSTRIAIIFSAKDQSVTTYINHECKSSTVSMTAPFTLHILPAIAATVQNLAFWDEALLEEDIHNLFDSGLAHIIVDHYRLSKYKKLANTWTFKAKQQNFSDGSLVALHEPFTNEKWKQTKVEAEKDEWKYFKTIDGTDCSILQLYGNTTYLVLDKSVHPTEGYTLIVDIRINHLPAENEQLTLITLNTYTSIYLSHEGRLCATSSKIESHSSLKLNQYVRLMITAGSSSLKLYIDGELYFDTNLSKQELTINGDHIDLFHEQDLTKNTTQEDVLRVECKSITYLAKCLSNIQDDLKSPNHSLEYLVALPYSAISPSLLLGGYEKSLIKSVHKQHPTKNIYQIEQIVREQQKLAMIATRNDQLRRQHDLLAKVNPSIDTAKLKNLLPFSSFDTDEKIITLGAMLFDHWNTLKLSRSSFSSDKDWFDQTVHHLDIGKKFNEWYSDKTASIVEESDYIHRLFDINRISCEPTPVTFSDQWRNTDYSHENIPRSQFIAARIACEHGLISMYAHYTILAMLNVWSTGGSTLFPLEKFGDFTFLLTLFRLLDYHYHNTRLHTDESIDRMALLIKTVLNGEFNELLKHESISVEALLNKAPFLYQLQKSIVVQMLQLIANPSLLIGDTQSMKMIQKPDIQFILKLFTLFLSSVVEPTTRKQTDIEFLLPLVFPEICIEHLFDLFLLCSTHRTKIAIVRLFSTLIHRSTKLHFSKRIRHFFCHLCPQLLPDSTSIASYSMKTFQTAALDFVYLLYEKYKKESLNSDLSRVFQSLHDLITFVNTLNALTDRTKQISFPELFILQSTVALDGSIQFTREELEKSHHYFDTIADHQLIDFLNQHLLTGVSFAALIADLPSENTSSAKHYQNFPSLWHIPTHCIQTRVRFFWLFNLFVEKLVSIVDLSIPFGQSFLTDKIRSSRDYILHKTKSQLLETSLAVTAASSDDSMPSVNFNTIPANAVTAAKTMFQQAYEQLHSNGHILFRRPNERLWRAQYIGMHSTDQGGPYRDSITCICADICSNRVALFILCPNGRMNDGLNRDRWIPYVYPPNEPIPNIIKKQYRFVGQMMGMAIRKQFYLDLKFAGLVWKQLVRDEVILEDITAIDIQSFTLVNEMENNLCSMDESMNTEYDEMLTSILDDLKFEAMSADGQTYELIPGGRNISVTAENLREYCSNYRQYRLQEFSRQIEYIRQGLYSVVPGYYLSLYTARELEEAVCGKGEIDVELLKRNTNYGGDYEENSPCIQRFWTVLKTKFTEEQKKLFLKFVWGRSSLPNQDSGFTSKFVIDVLRVTDGSVNGALPRAHTCSFTLDLPEYSSVDVMYDRLNYAITNCSSIDGDGSMN